MKKYAWLTLLCLLGLLCLWLSRGCWKVEGEMRERVYRDVNY